MRQQTMCLAAHRQAVPRLLRLDDWVNVVHHFDAEVPEGNIAHLDIRVRLGRSLDVLLDCSVDLATKDAVCSLLRHCLSIC